MRENLFHPKLRLGMFLSMFLFFLGFQPGCSYKRCSYKLKKVYLVWHLFDVLQLNKSKCDLPLLPLASLLPPGYQRRVQRGIRRGAADIVWRSAGEGLQQRYGGFLSQRLGLRRSRRLRTWPARRRGQRRGWARTF